MLIIHSPAGDFFESASLARIPNWSAARESDHARLRRLPESQVGPRLLVSNGHDPVTRSLPLHAATGLAAFRVIATLTHALASRGRLSRASPAPVGNENLLGDR